MEKSKHELPVIFLMGPTATGKTGLAVELHKRFPMDIISVDSAMVYRGMDIGTAKPNAETLSLAPHRLIDICDPVESYSAARFCQDAIQEINNIHATGRIPLLVGGTGLYFRSLEKGLSELPEADTEIRLQLESEAKKHGWKYMHDRLVEVDPETAGRIHPNDPQRIQRALEVYEITGIPMSKHFLSGQVPLLDAEVIKIVVAPGERYELHKKIALRFHQMLTDGLIDEVKRLHSRGDLHHGLPSMRMVGYRQVWQYLDGALDHQQMIDHAIVATRQLAKRQMTWLRKEENSRWFVSEEDDFLYNLLNYIDNYAEKIS